MARHNRKDRPATGGFVTCSGERYYRISNVDAMPPFLISLVSDDDHWMFVASNGGLTAGRVAPDNALFPYVTADKIYDSTPHTGSKTLLRVEREGRVHSWEPFNAEHDAIYNTQRNLYKNLLGDRILFEEINDDLQLAFRYQWASSAEFGFVREVQIENLDSTASRIELVDGLQNLLPADTPRLTQANASYLVDAYKWSELDAPTGLGLYTLFSGITDRAEPAESLQATTVFCLGLDEPRILLSSPQLDAFRRGGVPEQETRTRGVRGAYLVYADLQLPARARRDWQIVANLEQSQADAVALRQRLRDPREVASQVQQSIAAGSDALARIVAAADGFQATAQENVSAHHYANVLFNVMRGGIFAAHNRISTHRLRAHLRRFNAEIYNRHEAALEALPTEIDTTALRTRLSALQDKQLDRLVLEYLPLTFGRRHGDPSRPWNDFAIRLRDESGKRMLSYQGNWRDIFQNWEALLFSYPAFIDNVIAKFLNATTADGYNPYRITHEGIDWEIEEPDDPWSYIGYWGDHQIIYLLKLLEASEQFHPMRLAALMDERLYAYANVPYKIRPFESIIQDARNTVDYDPALEELIEQRVATLGADGRLMPDTRGAVGQVTLLEKLLVPLLSKLGNLVVDGGIWLNTQRPEWNDANNALVGYGLSMVTMCYLRRYVVFLRGLLADRTDDATVSREVARWLEETAAALQQLDTATDDQVCGPHQRHELLMAVGRAAGRYRENLYDNRILGESVAVSVGSINALLDGALVAIERSIHNNRGEDGLYHAYNLLELDEQTVSVERLYPMLEGQVAALSSGAMTPAQAADLVDALFASALFRADQASFLLYPDRSLPGFLEKNVVPATGIEGIGLLTAMIARGDHRVVEQDLDGNWRFNASLTNAGRLDAALDELGAQYGPAVASARASLHELYETVFRHKAFTGRSGGMFAFEGLGSIYWHMVAKLLLAVQENFFVARERDADATTCARLAHAYYRIRDGLGFNKSAAVYGAFPTDPYSHTPAHAGAQQPGMTGQVKEELLTRFGELGIRVRGGRLHIDTALLRAGEFSGSEHTLRYLDVEDCWQELSVPAQTLAFTVCQVPFVYRWTASTEPGLTVHTRDTASVGSDPDVIDSDFARHIFARDGHVRCIEVLLRKDSLLPG